MIQGRTRRRGAAVRPLPRRRLRPGLSTVKCSNTFVRTTGRALRMRLIVSLIAALGTLSGPAFAQWLNYRAPGIPRTKDGKPNLSAPAPRTSDGKADFTGIWRIARPPSSTPPPPVPSGTGNGGLKNFLPPGETIPFQPWAEELYKKRVATNGVGLPSEHCLPHGLPGAMMIPIAFQIVQTPAQISVL